MNEVYASNNHNRQPTSGLKTVKWKKMSLSQEKNLLPCLRPSTNSWLLSCGWAIVGTLVHNKCTAYLFAPYIKKNQWRNLPFRIGNRNRISLLFLFLFFLISKDYLTLSQFSEWDYYFLRSAHSLISKNKQTLKLCNRY